MSFLQEHYEKVALAVGGLALAGFIGLGASSYTATGGFIKENNGVATKQPQPGETLSKRIAEASSSLTAENTINPLYLDDAEQRQLFMLKSIDLYGKKGSKKPIDILYQGSKPVHPPIPNSWWFDNKLQEVISYENALQVDSDEDGFNNLDEFKAKTNPKNKRSYPELLPKLFGVIVDAHDFKLSFNEGGETSIYLRVQDKIDGIDEEEEFKIGQTAYPKVGNKAKRFKNRFKYLAQKKVKGEFGDEPVVVLKDLFAVKGKQRIQVKRNAPTVVSDLTVDLALTVLGEHKNIKTFKLGETFSLPFGNKDKNYIVKAIDRSGNQFKVTIQKKGGAALVLEVPAKH